MMAVAQVVLLPTAVSLLSLGLMSMWTVLGDRSAARRSSRLIQPAWLPWPVTKCPGTPPGNWYNPQGLMVCSKCCNFVWLISFMYVALNICENILFNEFDAHVNVVDWFTWYLMSNNDIGFWTAYQFKQRHEGLYQLIMSQQIIMIPLFHFVLQTCTPGGGPEDWDADYRSQTQYPS